jgi:uncharacterized RmlC-like cupin family protein
MFISEWRFLSSGLTNVIHVQKEALDRKGSEMGTFFAVDMSVGSKHIAAKYDVIPPNVKTDSHAEAHPTDTIIYMVSGELLFHVTAPENKSYTIRAGDFVYVPAGEKHYAENKSDSIAAEAIVCIPAPGF